MKGFGRVLKDFWNLQLSLLVLGAFVLIIVVLGCSTMNSVDDLLVLLVCFVIFAGLALLAVFIYDLVIILIYFSARKQIKAIPGFSAERFEREVARMPRIGNLVLCSDAICYSGTCNQAKVIPIHNVLWAYQEQVQNVLFLQIYTKDREKHSLQIVMKKKYGNRDMAVRFLLRLIARKNKGAIIGYKEDYETMFEKNFHQLLEMTRGKEIVDSRLLEQEYVQNNYYVRDLQ